MGLYIIGISGASGTVYAKSLIRELLALGHDIELIVSDAGKIVAREEMGWEVPSSEKEASAYFNLLFSQEPGKITCYSNNNLAAPPASGSCLSEGMVIIPSSMGTVSGVATGRSSNLLERAADVVLKERRPLVMVPREAPMNAIHLKNLLTLAELGVSIMPACPSFYQNPGTIEDLVAYFTLRTLDQLGIHHPSGDRWPSSERNRK